MSNSLETKAVKNSYGDILQVPNSNGGIDGTLRPVRDGKGDASALSLSTSAVQVNGNFTVTGDSTIPTYEAARTHVARTDNPHAVVSSQVNFTPSGTGAAVRTTQSKLRDWVSPEDFGAAGNGTTDDRAALLAAMQSGRRVDGGGRTYAVAGVLQPSSFSGLQNIVIKQTSPSALQTLYLFSLANVSLNNVEIDANGQVGNGSQGSSHALYIHNCDNARVSDVTVRNGGAISGVTFQTISGLHASRVRVLNFAADFASQPTDDEFHGIYVVGVQRFVLSDCTVDTQTPNWPGRPTIFRRWGRGFVFAACAGGEVSNCIARNVDQGFDATGSALNSNIVFSDCMTFDCTTVGFKTANFWQNITYADCFAVRSGFFGYLFGGASEVGQTPQSASASNCWAVDTGSSGLWSPTGQFVGAPTGFRIMNAPTDPSYPRAVRFRNCFALDQQTTKTMYTGFSSDVSAGVRSSDNDISTVSNCESIGHISNGFSGIGGHVGSVLRTTAQSIPSGVWTTVSWSSSASDIARLWDEGNTLIPRMSGIYLASSFGEFESNATGVRGMRFQLNGNPRAALVVPAASSGVTPLAAQWFESTNRNNTWRVQVFQDSGSALDFTSGRFGIARIADAG